MATRTTGGSSGKRPSAPSFATNPTSLPLHPDELLDADLLAEQPGGLDGSDLRTRHAALLAAGGSLGGAIDDVAEAIGQCIDEIRRRSLVTHVLEQSRRKLVVLAQHVKDIEAQIEDRSLASEDTGETIPSPRPAPDPIVADGEDPLLDECERIFTNAPGPDIRGCLAPVLSFLRAKWAQAPEAMQCLDGEEDCDACP